MEHPLKDEMVEQPALEDWAEPGWLIIFDKDGTLVQDFGNRPANSRAEQVIYPGVKEYLDDLNYFYGCIFAVCSNQGGVAYGLISEKEAQGMMWDIADQLRGVYMWQYCPHHPGGTVAAYAIDCDCRKPKAGMIRRIIKNAIAVFNQDPEKIMFVGDQPTDKAAAEAAGIKFMWAHEFFQGLVPARPDFNERKRAS